MPGRIVVSHIWHSIGAVCVCVFSSSYMYILYKHLKHCFALIRWMNKRPCMRRTIQPLLPIKFYEPFSFPLFASTLIHTMLLASHGCEAIPISIFCSLLLFSLWQSLIRGFIYSMPCYAYIPLWKFLICPGHHTRQKEKERKSVSEKSQVRQNPVVLCVYVWAVSVRMRRVPFYCVVPFTSVHVSANKVFVMLGNTFAYRV